MVLYDRLLSSDDVLHDRIRLDAQLFREVRDGNIHRNEYGSGRGSIWGYAWQSRKMGFWMAVTVVVGFFICSRGLQNGLEKITKWMMAALLVLILVLAGHSLILPGAKEGLSFYLLPNFKRASEVGLGSVIMAGHEPVLLYIKSWHCGNGDLRKLHVRGTYACR